MKLRIGVLVALAALVVSGCGKKGSSPSSPSDNPPVVSQPAPPTGSNPSPPSGGPSSPPTTNSYAYPEAGVSNEVWNVGFIVARDGDPAKVFHPGPPAAVHLDVSGFSQDIQAVFAEMASVADATGDTRYDLNPLIAGGAVFKVNLNPQADCFGDATGACTSLSLNLGTGQVNGGKIDFVSEAQLRNKSLVLHEILSAGGIAKRHKKPGILAEWPWNNPYPSEEERIMLRARSRLPAGTICAPSVCPS